MSRLSKRTTCRPRSASSRAEVLVPGDHLRAEAHHQQRGRMRRIAEGLVAEGDPPADVAELLGHDPAMLAAHVARIESNGRHARIKRSQRRCTGPRGGGAQTPFDRHDPRPLDGRGAEGERRPPGHGDGAGAAGICALPALPARQPEGHRVARPRSLRAQLRPRLRAAVLAAASLRLRPRARRPRTVPPVGLALSRAPRARTYAGHRGDDRTARAGRRQRRRHGDGRALPR